jgi:hypothetical protein
MKTSRLRSSRLDFKSTCNRRQWQYSSMHYNYNNNTNHHTKSTDSGDQGGGDDEHRDDERHLTQLYPIQEITADKRMEQIIILDGGVVVVDHVLGQPHIETDMSTSSSILDGGDDGDCNEDHYSYNDEDVSDWDDESDDSYDDLQYSDSDTDDDGHIPSQELVVSLLEDDTDSHHSRCFQQAEATKRMNHFHSQNVRNASIVHGGDDSSRSNTCIADRRSLHVQCQKSLHVPNKPPTAKTIPCKVEDKDKTDSQPSLDHQQKQLVPITTTSTSSNSTRSSSFMTREEAGKHRRRRNHAMSQGDFCELFRHLAAANNQ